MQFQKNILLKNYTTFKIGGPAKYFCAIKDKEELVEAIAFAKKGQLPFFVLGGGSNLLVSDKGFKGLVLKIQDLRLRIKDSTIYAGAGASLTELVNAAANAGLSGMEWAAGIPGATVGGAIRGNAGAFEVEMKDIVRKVEAFDANDLRFKIYDLRDCGFSYRSSIFKKNPNLIIISAELNLKKNNKRKVREKMKEILNYRMDKHPKFPSAGSIFKNFENIRARDLIEKAGLKGKKIGGAQISDQHANFIINTGRAKAKDVLALIDLAKKEVKNKLGVAIEEEIQILS
ncbi:MAG: UDP-N-acetylmuramate dehydrogenase [Candidatus Nealsonbacteria bacterium]|nr:UDP-N-acetylmuramate dehydrogenase [Candidatus Nealsonbacteria bacterium]